MNINEVFDGDLEKLVDDIQQAGYAWVEAKLLSDQLDDDIKPFLASIMNDHDDNKRSEAKLDRLARGSNSFRKYIEKAAVARAETLKKRVHYDSLQSLFEARRSQFALERAKVEKGIFATGR